jgi:sugar lactone lactonase YvrE
MLSANGMVSTVAGGDAPLGVGPYAQQCYRPVDGSCAKATFAAPQGIAVDAAGNIYVADFGDLIFMPSILGTIMGYAPSGGTAIRKITDPGSASCTVSTLVAATGACGADSYINFDGPGGLTLDAVGNLYVTQAAAIRKVTPAGVVTTIAGNDNGVTGNTDGPAASATFNGLSGIALDNQGNLYVADSGNHAIRKITPDGMVSTWAGSGALGYTNFSSIGYATINGLTIDTDGNLYLADSYNNAVRRITPDGQVTTLASGCPTGRTLFGNSGTLQPSIRWDAMPTDQACFNGPTGVAVDASGAIYVADTYNFAIRKIAPAQ